MKFKAVVSLATAATTLFSIPAFAQGANTADFTQYLTVPRDETAEVLPLETAVEMAIKNSSEIKNSNMSITLGEKQRDDAYFSYETAQSGQTIQALFNLMKQNVSQNNAVKNQDVLRQQIAYNMKEAYSGIINDERSVELLKRSIELERKKLALAEVKYSIGAVSQKEYEDEKLALKKSEESLETKKKSLEETYRSFNTLIGVGENKSYALELPPQYNPLTLETTIENYAAIYCAAPLSIRQKKRDIDIAKQAINVEWASDNVSDTSLQSAKNNYAKATLDYEDTVNNFKNTIIFAYNSIKETEKSIDVGFAELENLKKKLEINNVKYQNGEISQIDIMQCQYDIAAKEDSVLRLMYDHMLAVEKFNNLDLLAG